MSCEHILLYIAQRHLCKQSIYLHKYLSVIVPSVCLWRIIYGGGVFATVACLLLISVAGVCALMLCASGAVLCPVFLF